MSGPLRFVYASDLHGDRQNAEAVKVLLEVTKSFKPHVKIFGGDLFDFRPLRRGASEEEKQHRMDADWQRGIEFLNAWKPHHLLLGNHDKRLYDLAESKTCGVKAAYAQNLCMDFEEQVKKLRCELRPWSIRGGVLRLGTLNFLHGFYHGKDAVKRHVADFHDCIFGHVHNFGSYTAGHYAGRHTARSCGALCETIQDYNESQPNTLRHENGFYLGLLHEDGSYLVQEARQTSSGWFIPTGFKRF